MQVSSPRSGVSSISLDTADDSYEESASGVVSATSGDDSTEEAESDQAAQPYDDDERVAVKANDEARYGLARMSLGDLDAIDDILLVGSAGGAGSASPRFVEITVDSRAAEVVAPPSFALGIGSSHRWG